MHGSARRADLPTSSLSGPSGAARPTSGTSLPPPLSAPLGSLGAAADAELVRHPDLWFSDGSVVLRAQHTLFRVHQSQLARHSAFFRDLFSLPQPAPAAGSAVAAAGAVEGAEGCPVLRLYDDPEDVAALLSALYDGPVFGDNSRADFARVSGMLRLAHKYLVDGLRARALAHLAAAWPRTLAGWDAREDGARAFEAERAAHGGLRYPSPVDVINLAHEVDALALLPAAFYDLSRYPYTQLFEPGAGDPLHAPRGAGLAPDDLRRLMLGKEAATHAVVTLVQAMGRSTGSDVGGAPALSGPSAAAHTMHGGGGAGAGGAVARTARGAAQHARKASGRACASAAACRRDVAELVELATQHYVLERERGAADPLYVAEELGQLKGAEFSDCKACGRALEMWARRERERVWRLVPVWFRLEAA